MAEPRTFALKRGSREGIRVTYVKRRRVIRLSGWYDGFVGMDDVEMPLGEFLRRLGIDEAAVRRALAATDG